MGNLLAYNQSFDWIDRKIDRGILIENLSSAINKAGKQGDSIYKTPDLHNLDLPWGELLAILANSCYDHEAFKQEFPWITQLQYQTLMAISYVFQSTTPDEAKSFEELIKEFPGQNNALIGFRCECTHQLVHDPPSWEEFHRSYVSTFSFDMQCQNYEYFISFYKPYLKIEAGHIRKVIFRHSVNKFIKRLDAPKFDHDKYHVHFDDNNNSALNLDGTWRHSSCNIPVGIREILSNWGFLLPSEYYY